MGVYVGMCLCGGFVVVGLVYVGYGDVVVLLFEL